MYVWNGYRSVKYFDFFLFLLKNSPGSVGMRFRPFLYLFYYYFANQSAYYELSK